MSEFNELKEKYATEVKERWNETDAYKESEQKQLDMMMYNGIY